MIVLCDDVKKADIPNIALLKLRKFLDTNEPELVQFLQSLWNAQGRAITYKELREAILKGYITKEILDEWQKDYSRFVIRHVEPRWRAAMEAANEPIERYNTVWHFNSDAAGVREWNKTNAARFVTAVNGDQIAAINYVVQRASQMHDFNVDSLSRVIRPMVGLNYRQAAANMNYYEAMISSGMNEKKAIERSIRYSARQSRYRGYLIARTELAFSYGQGAYLGTLQAQDAGLLGPCQKVWCTAEDERVCSICGSLDGVAIDMDVDFYYNDKKNGATRINPRLKYSKAVGKTCPAHPQCRCTVIYEELSPPIIMM